MFKDRISLFNRRGALWYPTVLENVNLNIDRASVVKEYGENAADRCILNVHLPAVKPYLSSKEWAAVENPEDYITFAFGEEFDFFWEGEWEGNSPISDDDYGMMSFYDYMNKTHDNVFAVTGCSSFSVIPHLEVTGK